MHSSDFLTRDENLIEFLPYYLVNIKVVNY